jgi:hypothetical protein
MRGAQLNESDCSTKGGQEGRGYAANERFFT